MIEFVENSHCTDANELDAEALAELDAQLRDLLTDVPIKHCRDGGISHRTFKLLATTDCKGCAHATECAVASSRKGLHQRECLGDSRVRNGSSCATECALREACGHVAQKTQELLDARKRMRAAGTTSSSAVKCAEENASTIVAPELESSQAQVTGVAIDTAEDAGAADSTEAPAVAHDAPPIKSGKSTGAYRRELATAPNPLESADNGWLRALDLAKDELGSASVDEIHALLRDAVCNVVESDDAHKLSTYLEVRDRIRAANLALNLRKRTFPSERTAVQLRPVRSKKVDREEWETLARNDLQVVDLHWLAITAERSLPGADPSVPGDFFRAAQAFAAARHTLEVKLDKLALPECDELQLNALRRRQGGSRTATIRKQMTDAIRAIRTGISDAKTRISATEHTLVALSEVAKIARGNVPEICRLFELKTGNTITMAQCRRRLEWLRKHGITFT